MKKLVLAGVITLGLSQTASADDHGKWGNGNYGNHHDNGYHRGWDDDDDHDHDDWRGRGHRRNVVVRREYYSAPVTYYYPQQAYYQPYYTYVAPAPVYYAPRPYYSGTSFNFRF